MELAVFVWGFYSVHGWAACPVDLASGLRVGCCWGWRCLGGRLPEPGRGSKVAEVGHVWSGGAGVDIGRGVHL